MTSTKRSDTPIDSDHKHVSTQHIQVTQVPDVVSASDHSSPTVISEDPLSPLKLGFTRIEVPDIAKASVSVSELNDTQLIEHCIEYLFLHQRTTAPKPTHDVLARGFEILAEISDKWPKPLETIGLELRRIMNVHVELLSVPDTKALYHVLSTLAGCSSFLEFEYREHLFEISVFLWALRIGPRGLAQGWEDGLTTVEVLYAAEQECLTAHHQVDGYMEALVELGREFRAWGVKVRSMIDEAEEISRCESNAA